MNAFAELLTEEIEAESDPSLQPERITAGELGAEAATRYLQAHREGTSLPLAPDITGNAMAAAFIFGLLLGRLIRP